MDDDNNYIYTEDLDYSQTPNQSIWGDGDPETLELLQSLISKNKINGHWLHFAAGDGRYNNLLLSEVNSLIATDYDEGALKKLQKQTPPNLIKKLSVKKQDITKPFEFEGNSFDGVFNTGTLHLFPAEVLQHVFSETYRVLKKRGVFIFDFATDVRRVRLDGSLMERTKITYSQDTAKIALSDILEKNNFSFELLSCSVPPEEVTAGEGTYLFSCNYWLVVAQKNDL